MIGVAEVCHALAGCLGIIITDFGTGERLTFETREECHAAFEERMPHWAAILVMQFGPFPVTGSLKCLTEDEAERLGIDVPGETI